MKKVVFMVCAIILAIVVYTFLAKSVYIQRGYWAVGGEIFVPIVIIVWAAYDLFKEEN